MDLDLLTLEIPNALLITSFYGAGQISCDMSSQASAL